MNYLNDSQIKTMYQQSYYLLSMLMQFKVRWTDEVPTAGVTYIAPDIHLLINKNFYNSLTDAQQIAVLLHEVLHVHYNHIFSQHENYPDKTRYNIACDLAINSHPEIMPLKEAGLGVWADQYKLPFGETTDFYYYNLPPSNNSQSAGNNSQQHAHQPLSSAAKSAIEGIKRKAEIAASTMKRTVYGGSTTHDWKRTLSAYISSADDYEIKHSHKKSNRRTENWNIPGKKKLRHKKVVVVVDTSGSMLSYFEHLVTQIAAISATGQTEVHIIQCDTVASAPTQYKKGQPVELIGGGGTLYQPGLDAATALNPDVIVYVGDMEHFDTLLKPKAPVIWVNTISQQKPNCQWGKFVFIRPS